MEFRQLASIEAAALIDRLVAAMEAEGHATTQRIQATADTALAQAAAEVGQIKSELSEARAKAQTLAATIDQLRGEAKKFRTAFETSQSEKQGLQEAVEKTGVESKALRATIRKMETEHAKRREDLERAVQEACDRTAEARSADLDYFRRAFKRLEDAPTVKETVLELASCLADLFPRVLLFDVNRQQLEGRWQAGFTLQKNISKVVVPLTPDTPFGEALQSGRPRQISSDDLRNGWPALFAGAPGFGLILPVVIDGKTCGVMYVDDSGKTGQPLDCQRAAGSAEILLLHAMPLLVRLAVQERAAAYEKQLLNELQIV